MLAAATEWLSSGDVIREAQKLNPKLDRLNLYSACSKLGSKGKIARMGDDPKTLKYATHEHAKAWAKITAGGTK